MKTKFTYLLMIVMAMTMSLVFTSCGDDDEEEGPVGSTSIVGTWSLEGSTTDNPNIITFGKDGKGTEETRSGISNFTYTLSPVNQAGVMPLKLYFIDSSKVLNFDATRTGNTLMLSSGGSVRIYNKI
ncbi:hypothetical protein [uncultured Parabacteroides sp.]|uniref:hypothetical protein n=1 Tax=uncultured Parabacteroides sp. TaxID=512312 RepID=UPI0025FEB175|nr:hypothetical protein [uncultured Parabacteroides sp.]